MRIFLIVVVVLSCVVAKSGKKCTEKKENSWTTKFNKCLDLGYVRRRCGDEKTNNELTPEMKKLKCGKMEKKLTKNCGMKCPEPDPEPEQSCWDGLQKDYRGKVNVTTSGYPCMNWRQQSPHSHSRTEANYPDTGLGDHNYCRNPDNEPEGAWCYTTNPDQRWDYCGVPKCTGATCWSGLQKDYRGPLQTTASGKKCQKWTAQDPHVHSRTVANYPNSGLGDHNRCRNPDNEPDGAWCYTTDSESRWEYCGVPKCAPAK